MANRKRCASIAPRLEVLEFRRLLSVGASGDVVAVGNTRMGHRFDIPPAHESLLGENDAGPEAVAVDSSGASTGDPVPGEFLGISNSGWTPPDENLAVGPSLVIEAVNEQLAFFNK